jgi:hypothetical protein
MTEDHFSAIVAAAEAKKNNQGWLVTEEGRHVTLYVSAQGTQLTVARVEALRVEGQLLKARTVRGELYILALEDVFAAAVEAETKGSRRAGFG